MGMGTDEDDRSQPGREAMAGEGRGDANGGACGRAGGSRGARAQTSEGFAAKRETTGGTALQADPEHTSKRTKRARARKAGDERNGEARKGDAKWARGDERADPANLSRTH